MPDHEEAVRGAEWTDNEWRDYLVDVVPSQFVDEFESAIRASERAKYAALEREVRNVLRQFYAENTPNRSRTFPALDRAIAALQSKEGTNE